MSRLRQMALVGLASVLLVACSGVGAGGHDGGPGSAGATGNGGTTTTGGHTGSGGATATGGSPDGGTVNDAGHDMSGPPCRTNSDCPSGTSCTMPGAVLCGTCTHATNPCTSDSDCAPDAAIPVVCARDLCDCTIDTMVCKPGCLSDADCEVGESCSPTHHCAATPCGPGLPACGTDMTCASAFGVCGLIACSSDSQCSKACVDGICFSTLGQCLPPG